MLTQLDLSNFKCFGLLKLPLAPLTLLAGRNASGKSSVLQALALLHQTMREHEWSTRLMLNGSLIRLGTVADVVDKVYGRQTAKIAIGNQFVEAKWTLSGERSDMSMLVERVEIDGQAVEQPASLRYLLPLEATATAALANTLRRLTFIAAERIGPREVYALEDRHIALSVGAAGEHTPSVLYLGSDQAVLESLALPGVPRTIPHQVQERMRTIFPGCSIVVQNVPRMNSVTLGLRTSEDTDFHRPIHVGFGLTQALPIVVAALAAKQGDILLIENPEVHLHPSGQSLIGEFLAEVSNVGVQVVLETHSDHVLSGIRRAVRSGAIPSDKVAIHFFQPRIDGHPQVLSPRIDSRGGIDNWPDGFFDQFDIDLTFLAGWGK